MNAPLPPNPLLQSVGQDLDPAHAEPRLREIPYNYTSFSDREILIRGGVFGESK